MFKKPIILALGCSFTSLDFRSHLTNIPEEERGGWPMWPELLRREIEKETGISYTLINLARSGASNDVIFKKFIHSLAKYGNRIKIVLVGGTQWMRSHVVISGLDYNPQVKTGRFNYEKTYEKSLAQTWESFSNTIGVQNVMYHNLRIMWTLLNMCNDKKIKFIWNQLLCPVVDAVFQRRILKNQGVTDEYVNDEAFSDLFFSETILKSPYAKLIIKHKERFYGFPWSHGKPWDLGSHMDRAEKIVYPKSNLSNSDKFKPQDIDVHPNKFGQKDIAQEMWKVYGNYLVKN